MIGRWQYNPYAPIALASAAVCLWCVAYVRRGRSEVAGSFEFAMLSLLSTLYTLGIAGDLSSAGLEQKLLFLGLIFFTFPFVPFFALRLALVMVGRQGWLTRARSAWMLAPSVALVLLYLTNGAHHLVQTDSVLVERVGYTMRAATAGPAFWIFALYGYGLLLIVAIIYATMLIQSTPVTRTQAGMLLLGTLGPWGTNAISIFHLGPDPLFDLTPTGYLIACTAWAYALRRGRLLDLSPVARAAVFDRMGDAVLVLDTKDRVVDANGALLSLIGKTLGDTLGREPSSLGLSLVGSELELGGRSFAVNTSSLESPESRRVAGRIVVIHDITARKRAELAQREAARAAEELARARAAFLARTSHEVRTPLYGVLGATEVLLDTALDQRQRALLETVQRSGRGLLAVVDEVLDFAKLDADRMELSVTDYDVFRVVADVGTLFQPAAEAKGLRLEVALAGVRAWGRGDALRTRQVVTNLVSNAIKFTARGTVRVSCELDGERAAIEVEDTGIGIAPEVQGRVFEAFRQGDESTARRFGGTGLGLAIAHRLVELMGGTIDFTSRVGEGTVFRVELPYPAASRREIAGRGRAVTLPFRSVLVVDDHEVGRSVTRSLLERAGCDVVTAASGEEALDLAGRRRFDLILLDVWMPEMNGPEVVRRLRARGDTTAVIVFTAEPYGTNHWPADLPVDGWVLKDDPARIYEALALAREAAPSPTEAIVDLFARTSEGELEALARAAREDDRATVSRLLHALEGSARIVGARRVSDACAALRLETSPAAVGGGLEALGRARDEDLATLRRS